MAKSKQNVDDAGQVHQSSSEVAEEREHVARTPASPVDPQGGPSLTGHTSEAGIVEDPDTGKVQAYHQTNVVTDPESPDAVITAPGTAADGRAANPLGAHGEPSPNEVAAGADPVEPSAEDSDRGSLDSADNS